MLVSVLAICAPLMRSGTGSCDKSATDVAAEVRCQPVKSEASFIESLCLVRNCSRQESNHFRAAFHEASKEGSCPRQGAIRGDAKKSDEDRRSACHGNTAQPQERESTHPNSSHHNGSNTKHQDAHTKTQLVEDLDDHGH
jgi:hypothetical protein